MNYLVFVTICQYIKFDLKKYANKVRYEPELDFVYTLKQNYRGLMLHK